MALVRSDAPTASQKIRKTTRRPETPKRKRRPGRPSSYRPEYCDVVIEAGKEGWSLTATAAKIGVHRATLFDWGTAHPEFGDALKVHRAHRAHWWEERLRDVAKNGGAPGQATACIFGLKNAVPEEWRDIQHQEHSGNTTETKTLRLELSPRALAHVEELSRLLLGDDDDEPETTDGVLIEGRQADDAPQPNGKGNGSDGSAVALRTGRQ